MDQREPPPTPSLGPPGRRARAAVGDGHKDAEVDETPAPRGPSRAFGPFEAGVWGGRRGLWRAAGAVALVAATGFAVQWGYAFVNSSEAYRFHFRDLVLEPPPPSWYRGGSAAFLEGVAGRSKFPEAFSTLDFDKAAMFRAFELDPVVEKVRRVEVRPGGRVSVALDYHQPVALARFPDGTERVLDRDADLLPAGAVNVAAARPLVELRDFPPPHEPRDGHRWYKLDGATGAAVPDARVAEAARLAGFLRDRIVALPSQAWDAFGYVFVHRNRAAESGCFVQVGSNLMFRWEAPARPGDGEPTEEEKWSMLLDWVKDHPPLAESPTFDDLVFTPRGVVLKARRTK